MSVPSTSRCLVTGATDPTSVGYVCAHILLQAGAAAVTITGRDPAKLDVTVLAEVRAESGLDPKRLERMMATGANRVLLPFADYTRDKALAVLDEYAAAIARVS